MRRTDSGEFRVDAGHFAESKESVGGIYVIDVASMDQALEWARKGRFMPGANEVRQIWEE